MIYKKHSDALPNVLIPNYKKISKKSCNATLGKTNRSFVAFSDNILTLLIRTLSKCLRQIIHTHSSMKILYKPNLIQIYNFLQIEISK